MSHASTFSASILEHFFAFDFFVIHTLLYDSAKKYSGRFRGFLIIRGKFKLILGFLFILCIFMLLFLFYSILSFMALLVN